MKDRAPREPFTALDWIAVVVALFATAVLIALTPSGPSYRAMYADFGGTTPLPLLTVFATSYAGPIVLASSALAVLGVGLRADGLRARRAGVVAAFVIALLGLTTCYVGLNLPLWQLAGSISGE